MCVRACPVRSVAGAVKETQIAPTVSSAVIARSLRRSNPESHDNRMFLDCFVPRNDGRRCPSLPDTIFMLLRLANTLVMSNRRDISMKKFTSCIFALAISLLIISIPVYATEYEQKPYPPTIEKSVNPTIGQSGDIVRYTIIVHNPNDTWVGEHIVRDCFPAHKIRPYMDTLTITRDGVPITGGNAVTDSFVVYDYCFTEGYVDLLFYGLPPLSETVIVFYFRVLPDVVEDVKIVNEVTIWFTIWVPGPWNPSTGRPDPGYRDRGEYPVDDCYAVVNLQNGNGGGNGGNGGGGNGSNGGGGLPPWQPPGGGSTPQPPRVPSYTPPGITPDNPPPGGSPPANPPGLVPPWPLPPPPPQVGDVLTHSTPPPPPGEDEYVQTEQGDDTDEDIDDDDGKDDGTQPTLPPQRHNPQTSDDFTLTRLIVSAVGVMLSLGLVFFSVLKMRKR